MLKGITMRSVRWAGTILKYGAGVLCWLIIFGFLQHVCIFDISSVVDRLWMKDLHDDLVENVIGEIAFHVQAGRCVDGYIYAARYHPSRMDIDGESRSLTSLVDVATWREIGDPASITSTYLDSKHKYVLYTIEGDEYIRVVNR
jgi:hypothetical protein